MSRYLALDAEQGKIYLASANVKGSAVKLEKAIVLSDAGTLTASNAAELGKRLKEAMREAGMDSGSVLVAVGRERVVLKEIRYPATVSPADEPNVVRFQVSKELSESGDNVVIDYFAHPMPEPDGQRRALAFALRRDVLNAYRILCATAGLKIAGVTPRPFGVAASLMRAIKDGAVTPPDSPHAPLAVLARGDKWGELVILRGGHVSFARSLTAMAVNSETAMLGEIRRNIAVFAGQASQQAVQALYVAEGEMPGGWSGRLLSGLSIPVQAFDPIAGADAEVEPEHRGSFAGLAGLVALRARSAELPVNFLAPREPKRVTDPNKRVLALVGVCVALVFITVMAIGLWTVGQQSKSAESLRIQKQQLETEIAAYGDTTKRASIAKEWQGKSVSWLDELYDVTEAFPDPAGSEVVKFSGVSGMDPVKGATRKHIGTMELQIHTENERAIDTLNNAIHETAYRETGAAQRKGPTGDRRKNLRLDLFARLIHREPATYHSELKVAPATRRERPRDEKMELGREIKGVDPMGGAQ